MNYYIRRLLHYLRWMFIIFNKLWMSFIPKDRNLILVTSWFAMKYADSSKYEYEYLLSNSQYRVIWYTKNKDIYRQLNLKGLPVVMANSMKGIWYQIRAMVLITSIQVSDFNCMFYRKSILLDLGHGFIIKQSHFDVPGIDKSWILFQKLLRWGIDYRSTAASNFSCEKICSSFHLKPENVVFVNKPRIDVLFNADLRKGNNKIVDEAKNGRMAFVWMPTHRSCGEVPIDVNEILNLDKLQDVCKKNNVVFIIKKHYYHRNEVIDTKQYPNIFDFTAENLDVQTLLYQADVLISDYSASYIDFLVLDRPILLYAYDLEEYLKKERGLYVPFNENTAGEIIRNKEALYKAIDRISNDPYDTEYAEGRALAKLRYFDKNVEMGNSREQVKKIIDQLISGTYSHNWNM